MKKYNLKLLYVEDDQQTRENYQEFFKIFFEDIVALDNGEVAFDIFQKGDIDIVVTDINMEQLSGIELSKKIRKIDPNIPIVIFSAFPNQENLLESIDTGVTKFLVKPSKIKDIEKTLKDIAQKLQQKELNILKFDCNITWDLENSILYKDGIEVKLTKLEHQLLKLLCSNPKQTFQTDYILNYLWSDDIQKEYDTKSLRALVYRVKNKLDCLIIESVYKVGYKLILL